MDRSAKATLEITQAVIQLTLHHPNFSDFQIAQIISERFAIRIVRTTISRLRHLAHFQIPAPEALFNRADV
jgi:DNA-directed RNA polymerase specialized sigma54-like protein